MKNRANEKRYPHRFLKRQADGIAPKHCFCRCGVWGTAAEGEQAKLKYRAHLQQMGVI